MPGGVVTGRPGRPAVHGDGDGAGDMVEVGGGVGGDPAGQLIGAGDVGGTR